jgi:hypothetical protein
MLNRPVAALSVAAALALVVVASSASASSIGHSPTNKLIKWTKTDVPYLLNPAGSADITNGSDIAAIHESFADWVNLPCGALDATHAGAAGSTNILTGSNLNGKNEITWVETSAWTFGKYVLGVTVPAFAYSGKIGESDIAFNGYLQKWSTSGGFGKVDVKAIAIHEIGHFFGINHNLAGWSQSNPPTMAPAWDGTTKQRSLEQDDKNAFCFLYPAGGAYSCTKDDDCPYILSQQGNEEVYTGKYVCKSGGCVLGAATGDSSKGLGEACSYTQECAGNLFCQPLTASAAICTHTCTPGNDATCEPGFVCAPYQGGGGGACIPGQPSSKFDGTECTDSSECESGLCAINPITGDAVCQSPCNPSAPDPGCRQGETCVAGPNTGTLGACWPSDDLGGVNKPDDAPCEADFQCKSGYCVPDPDTGEQLCRSGCDPVLDNCAAGTWCVEVTPGLGICMPGSPPAEVVKLGEGAVCLTLDDCESQFCYKPPGSAVALCRNACSLQAGDCPEGFLCIGYGEPDIGVCMPSAGEPAGGPCVDPAGCASEVCVETEGEGVCSQQCIGSAVCPCGMSCAVISGLGAVCVPEPSAPGCAPGGVTCDSDLDCESGVCAVGACAEYVPVIPVEPGGEGGETGTEGGGDGGNTPADSGGGSGGAGGEGSGSTASEGDSGLGCAAATGSPSSPLALLLLLAALALGFRGSRLRS